MSTNDIFQGKHKITSPEVVFAKDDIWPETPMEPVDDQEVIRVTVRAVIHSTE